jgi:hypothetical protein
VDASKDRRETVAPRFLDSSSSTSSSLKIFVYQDFGS